MALVKARAKADTTRRGGFVFASARTGKTVEEPSLKNLVTHIPDFDTNRYIFPDG